MKVVVSTGAVSSKGPQGKDVAYGGNCEAIIRHSQDEGDANSSTIGASFMNWRGDIALELQRHELNHIRERYAVDGKI